MTIASTPITPTGAHSHNVPRALNMNDVQAVLDHLHRREFIHAVKRIKSDLNMGLKHAKDVTDEYRNAPNAADAESVIYRAYGIIPRSRMSPTEVLADMVADRVIQKLRDAGVIPFITM